MVRGIGVDIIEIERIRRSIESTDAHFLKRIFTESEIAYCDSKPRREQHFAARFAAKEAAGKALSLGWAGEFKWRDVEVTNDPSGKPRIILHGTLAEHLAGAAIMLSMSHSETHVVAMVLIEDGRL
jgi:holo-[acyl-carrier protein] synthase